MVRSLAKVIFLAVLVVAGSFGLRYYRDYFSQDQKIAELEHEKAQLNQRIKRLSDERRVADVLVTDQKLVNGVQQTTLLFVEYGHDGSTLPPKSFTVEGDQAHIDALVIKFEHGFVEENDELKGCSIALFTRIYGDRQTPDKAFPIDRPGQVPEFYRGSSPRLSQFEQDLWASFWQLYDDPAFAQKKGVRIANGQGVWGPFKPDQLYTITIEANGGLNITHEPLKGIYREALKRHGEVAGGPA